MTPSVALSIIIPAFQEEKRIGYTIEKLASYLDTLSLASEIILVLDGCTDNTESAAKIAIIGKRCLLNIIKLPNNCGKGFAVKQGMLAAAGPYLFFTDADLSFPPEIIPQFIEQLKLGADIAIAQRERTSTYSNLIRRIVGALSRILIGNLILPGIKDSQAGFKAFRAETAHKLFPNLQTRGYLFDLELLLLARYFGCKITKVSVDWIDRPGSKVQPIRDSIKASGELLMILTRLLKLKKQK